MKKIIVSLLVFVLLGSYKNTLCAEAAAPSQNITAGATRFPCIMEHSKLLASFEPEEFEEASKATTPASSIESDKQSTPLQGILIELTKKIDGRPFTENQSLQILTILEILLELFVTKQTDDLKGILHEITNLLETDINKSKISLTDLIYTAEMLQLPKEFMWLLTDPISTKFFQSPLPPDASQAHIKNITRFFGDTGTEEKKNVLKWLLAWMTGQKADTPETTISHPLKSRLISTLENSDFSSKITLSPDKTKFFSATKNNTVSVWDLEQGKFLYQLSHTGLINSTLFSPDSKKIITASNDGNAKIWDSATGAILKTLPHPIAISFATLSFDEKLALTLDIHKVVRVWDVENQINLYALQSADEMEFAQFNPEATKILTRSRSGNAKLWDVTTGTGQSYFEFPHAEVNYARFNADGTKIITCSWQGSTKIWDTQSNTCLYDLPCTQGAIRAMFNKDETKILTASHSKICPKLWDLATGNCLYTLNHPGAIHTTFSPDGKQILTSSSTCVVKIWNSATGKLTGTLKHQEETTRATFCQDSRTILTTSWDHTAKLWDSQSSTCIATLKHKKGVLHAIVNAAGNKIITLPNDKTIRIWKSWSKTNVTPAERLVYEALVKTGLEKAHRNSDGFCRQIFTKLNSRVPKDQPLVPALPEQT